MLHPDSERKLIGVHPRLIEVIRVAADDSPLIVLVTEGLRNRTRQAQLVKIGASQTMESKHLPQPDGFGHAVDTAFWLDDGDSVIENGEVRFDWPLYDKFAVFVRDAARSLRVRIVWGGVWDADLNTLSDDTAIEREMYAQRKRRQGEKAFLDGPHFQFMSIQQAA